MYKIVFIASLSLLLAGCPDDDKDNKGRNDTRLLTERVVVNEDEIADLDNRVATLEGTPGVNIQPLQDAIDVNTFNIQDLFNTLGAFAPIFNTLQADVVTLFGDTGVLINITDDHEMRLASIESNAGDALYVVDATGHAFSIGFGGGLGLMVDYDKWVRGVVTDPVYPFPTALNAAPGNQIHNFNPFNGDSPGVPVSPLYVDDCATPTRLYWDSLQNIVPNSLPTTDENMVGMENTLLIVDYVLFEISISTMLDNGPAVYELQPNGVCSTVPAMVIPVSIHELTPVAAYGESIVTTYPLPWTFETR